VGVCGCDDGGDGSGGSGGCGDGGEGSAGSGTHDGMERLVV
jgi:hypothetical protein